MTLMLVSITRQNYFDYEKGGLLISIKKVGFIGLGTMGAPMAKCRLKKGHPLAV